ncbi:MAG: RNA polymerase sigma factor [Anaerolineae bacterium]
MDKGGSATVGVVRPFVEEDAGDGLVYSAYARLTASDGDSEQENSQAIQEDAALSEERALIEAAKHDAEAFGKLYQKYVKRIYNYLYRHTGNQLEAEDLTSRTFFRALRSLHQYKDRGGAFQAWLFRIAHNLVVNWYRDQSRHPVISLEVAGDYPGEGTPHDEPHAHIVHVERQALVARLIAQLPEERKTLLILKFVEKMSNEDIGNVLGKTEGAIKSLYHRTLLDLRETLQQEEFTDGLF